MTSRNKRKNYMYEVEVSNNHDEEFALELFEMMEDTPQPTSQTKINSFDELLDWNEAIED